MHKFVFFSLLYLAQLSTAIAQTSDERLTGLDTAIARILKEWHCAGVAIAIVEKDKVIFSQGYGFANWEKKIPVTANTYFAAGSCTKPFTCALLGILKEEGKLDFDQPITQYLPQLSFANAALNEQVTSRDLMTHRTGLPRHDLSWAIFGASDTDSLLMKIKYHEPVAALRQKWVYNNFMYAALGKLTEQITGKKYEASLTEKILNPLKMEAINFSVDSMQQQKDYAVGYTTDAGGNIVALPYVTLDLMRSVGGINTTVVEMAKWLIPWLNEGKYKGKQILPANYVKEAMSNQMVVSAGLPSLKNPEVHFQNYGLGWFLSSYRGHYRVEHGGNIAGFSTNQVLFPTDGVGIVIFSNQENSNNKVMAPIRNLIADRMLKLPYKDWQSFVYAPVKTQMENAAQQYNTSPKKTAIPTKTITPRQLSAYQGLFHNGGYGNIQIRNIKDSLYATIGKNQFYLRHHMLDIFDVVPAEGDSHGNLQPVFRMVFYSDEQGEVSAAAIRLEPEQQQPTLFSKLQQAATLSTMQLNKMAGEYQMGNMQIKLVVKNSHQLFMIVPGQPEYEMVALSDKKLIIKDQPAFNLVFENDDEFTFTQPGATVKGKRKK